MKTSHLLFTLLVTFAFLAAACAPQATPTQAPPQQAQVTSAPATAAPATPAPVNTPAGPATVNVATNAKFGSILTDANGMTLYVFLNDTSTASTCSGSCITTWPALLTNGNPVAGSGVDGTKLGTTTRADGSVQVTYNGHPLYYFAKDKAAGDTNGQGIKSVWYVVSAAGDAIKQ